MEEQKQRRQELRPKPRLSDREASSPSGIQWVDAPKKRRGEEWLKNMAVAASLVICASVLRSGAIPSLDAATDAVLTAVTGDTLLDENLGKLSFVSSLFPETTLVFGQQTEDPLFLPVTDGEVVHAWSQSEPYMAWQTAQQEVCAVADGEVTAVFHGNDEERIIQVVREDGLTCLYGNIAVCSVTVGDAVAQGEPVGVLLEGGECVLEIRQDGRSVDPSALLP